MSNRPPTVRLLAPNALLPHDTESYKPPGWSWDDSAPRLATSRRPGFEIVYPRMVRGSIGGRSPAGELARSGWACAEGGSGSFGGGRDWVRRSRESDRFPRESANEAIPPPGGRGANEAIPPPGGRGANEAIVSAGGFPGKPASGDRVSPGKCRSFTGCESAGPPGRFPGESDGEGLRDDRADHGRDAQPQGGLRQDLDVPPPGRRLRQGRPPGVARRHGPPGVVGPRGCSAPRRPRALADRSTVVGLFDDALDPDPDELIQATPFERIKIVPGSNALGRLQRPEAARRPARSSSPSDGSSRRPATRTTSP